MSTFSVGRVGHGLLRVFVLAGVAAFLATSCKDSNDVAGVSNSTAPANLAGNWSGGFTLATDPSIYGESVPALAAFQQTGTSLEGTITITGSPTITIHATISGTRASGTIEDGSGAGTMHATFTAPQLTIILAPHDASRTGTVYLRR